MSMSQEQRETARRVHKDFFDRCRTAIVNGYYLEAIIMEYAAMEARMNIIMSLLGKPCSLCKDPKIVHNIGLKNKLECLAEIMDQNKELFETSKMPRSKVKRMQEWCEERNNRIHGLYTDTEKYGTLMAKNKKCAEKGFVLCHLLYNETDRLKRLNKRNPELLKCVKHDCHVNWNGCKEAITSLNSVDEQL